MAMLIVHFPLQYDDVFSNDSSFSASKLPEPPVVSTDVEGPSAEKRQRCRGRASQG